MEDLQLSTDGSLLSSLFYDSACSNDQEGFLFGQLRLETEEGVNDAHMNVRTDKNVVFIQGFCATETPYSFYSPTGEILEEKLQAILGPDCGRVVGWYRSRRNTSLEPLYMEKIIHKKLRDMSEGKNEFIFIIFASQVSTPSSTHTFDYICLRSRDGHNLESVPLEITNLGSSIQSDYKRTLSSGAGNKLLENVQLPSNVPFVREIRGTIEEKLKFLCEEVHESEIALNQLSMEVESLREAAKARQQQQPSDFGEGSTEERVSFPNVFKHSSQGLIPNNVLETNSSTRVLENEGSELLSRRSPTF